MGVETIIDRWQYRIRVYGGKSTKQKEGSNSRFAL